MKNCIVCLFNTPENIFRRFFWRNKSSSVNNSWCLPSKTCFFPDVQTQSFPDVACSIVPGHSRRLEKCCNFSHVAGGRPLMSPPGGVLFSLIHTQTYKSNISKVNVLKLFKRNRYKPKLTKKGFLYISLIYQILNLTAGDQGSSYNWQIREMYILKVICIFP